MATEHRESTHRWNVEETEAGVRICRGEHEKAAACEWEEYVLAAEPPVVVPSERERELEEMAGIGRDLREQNNRATAAPIFVVQQRRRIYGMDPDYSDAVVWVDSCNDYTQADPRRARALERMHERGEKIDGCWHRTAYTDVWEFVTACFTEQGCKDYIAANGHNLTDPRIYAEGSWRNREWQSVRDFLRALTSEYAVGSPDRGGTHE